MLAPPADAPPDDPELPPLCPPEGIDGMLDPPPPEEPPDGMLLDEPPPPPLEPELPPLGMLELLPPELPDEPEEPDEPDDPEELGGPGMLGEGMLEEDCCCAQPPMRNAETALMSVVFAAMTNSRRKVGLVFIAKISALRS